MKNKSEIIGKGLDSMISFHNTNYCDKCHSVVKYAYRFEPISIIVYEMWMDFYLIHTYQVIEKSQSKISLHLL